MCALDPTRRPLVHRRGTRQGVRRSHRPARDRLPRSGRAPAVRHRDRRARLAPGPSSC
jgi:hypothetical protein